MRRIGPALFLSLLLTTSASRASDFVDTRLSLTLTDENVLVAPGETNPSVAGLRFDRPNAFGILFFDNYDTRYTGYENLTHLVLYKKVERGKLDAEAALVFRFLEFNDVSLSSIDDGSYIKVSYFLDPTRESKTNISLTAFPLSSDRMRLGYSYRLSWGGSPMFFKFNPDLPPSPTPPVNTAAAPGARLQIASDRAVAWVGMKTSQLLNRNPQVNEQVAIYGFLGGASVDVVPDHFRLELNGGYFDRGTNPLMYSTQDMTPGKKLRDFPVTSIGASFQASVFSGLSPAGSLDYALYKNDPTSAVRYFGKVDYRPGLNWLAQTEFTVITTSLQDSSRPDSTTQQVAYAGDVNLRLQTGRFRAKLDASVRSLEFMLINQPSFTPYQAFATNAQITPDRFVSVGADYSFERVGLTAGLTFGVDLPATFQPPKGMPGSVLCPNVGAAGCSAGTVVVRGEGDYSIFSLDPKSGSVPDALPVVATKLLLREDFLDFFAAILDVYYSHDPNQTQLGKDPMTGAELFLFKHPDVLGFNLSLQARF